METDFLTSYDAIVVGTGMTESILAAALSRIGRTVLHLDANEYYGDLWASFNFEGLQDWIDQQIKPNSDTEAKDFAVEIRPDEQIVKLDGKPKTVWNIDARWHCKPAHQESHDENVDKSNEESIQKVEWTIEKVKTEYRKFNLDLTPKLLFSRGPMVELLIHSNVARYAEFKSTTRVLTWRDGRLEPVPCSRADVFATKNVSVVQKRMLVKLLTLCSSYPDNSEEFVGFEKKTFLEFLKHKKMPDNIIHYILYAISMSSDNTPCIEGVQSTKSFLASLGRYGNTPFLFPMYGSGEMSQCFCRLCAVYGGTYCLKRGIEALVINNENVCTGVVSNGQLLQNKHLILSSTYLPEHYLSDCENKTISRGIYVSDGSILPAEDQPITLLKYPPVDKVFNKSVTIIEAGSSTQICPAGLYTCHVTAECATDARTDLQHVVESLFRQEQDKQQTELKPNLVWSLTWNMSQGSSEISHQCPVNIVACSGPDLGLDFDHSIHEAQKLFEKICPGEEFLPRAPDPEELVFEDDNTDSHAVEVPNVDVDETLSTATDKISQVLIEAVDKSSDNTVTDSPGE